MNCQSCGKTVRETARFCDACGVRLQLVQTRIVIDLSARKEEVAVPAPLTPSFLFPQEVEKKRRFPFIPSKKDKQVKAVAPNGKDEKQSGLKADAKPLTAQSALPDTSKENAAS